MATKRFLRFFLSFVTTKPFYTGITTALICVGLSVFFALYTIYLHIVRVNLCIYHNISPCFAKTSGKHMANRISTLDGSFTITFISLPRYRAGCCTDKRISSLNANFLINAYFTYFFLIYGRLLAARC